MAAGLQIQVNTFEGPLSLLLYLIRKNEIDVYDIPIREITTQYLEYIKVMKELNLEVAGEFVAMAATLILIKSRMLVPQYDEHGEEIEEDPRKELVQKLLEYQKYQEASKQLYKRPLLGRDIWLRGSKDAVGEAPKEIEGDIILDEKGLFALISAFRLLMKQTTKSPHQVAAKGMSISARLNVIKDRFIVGNRMELRDLLEEEFTRNDLIITFLCVLELTRMGSVRVYQSEPMAPVYLEVIKVVTSDIVNRAQEFDAEDTEETANQILAKAEKDLEQTTMSDQAEAQLDAAALEDDAEVRAVEAGELI